MTPTLTMQEVCEATPPTQTPETPPASSEAAAPSRVTDTLAAWSGPLIADFDETLYLRNSTADFLATAWPGPLVHLLILLLNRLRPWRWSGGIATRDNWRVGLILVLLPWSLPRWRRRATALAEQARNQDLLKALERNRSNLTIATLGYRCIVSPLVAAMGLADRPLVAMRVWHFSDRKNGKLAMTEQALGRPRVRQSMVVTDSLDDQDLLQACAAPLHVVWPGADLATSESNFYYPGRYIRHIKHPGRSFIYRSIIHDELSVWILASVALAATPVTHVIGLIFLSLSFWAIYECGYADNDRIAERFESDPQLTDQFFSQPIRFPTWQPWIWAAGAGTLALFLLRWPAAPVPLDAVIWAGVLSLTFGWFRLYNRLDKGTRVWLFAGLQLLRSCSFIALVPVSLTGSAALLSHVLARWVPYYTYRATRTRFDAPQVSMTRLLIFMLIAAAIGVAQGWAEIMTPTGLVLLVWFLFKARHELRRDGAAMHWINARRGG